MPTKVLAIPDAAHRYLKLMATFLNTTMVTLLADLLKEQAESLVNSTHAEVSEASKSFLEWIKARET